MKYQVTDFRYISDKDTNVMFATNDRQAAITVADQIGPGTVVMRNDESGLKEVVYTCPYKSDLGISE